MALESGRGWRQVAGPELSPTAFRLAVVPDGPDCQWADGQYERIEARNRALLKEHFAKLAKDCQRQRDTPPTNIVGGYRFPGAPIIDLNSGAIAVPLTAGQAEEVARLIATIPADLSIPDFLKRTPGVTRG
jgi:hypothetical protein